MLQKRSDIERKKLLLNAVVPILFVAFLWLIKLVETGFGLSFVKYGIDPLHLQGLRGIVFAPFLHGSLKHLFNNSVPLFILAWACFYFYQNISWKVIFFVWIFSGLGTWLIGRPAYHIGASTLIYGLFSFLFFSGIFRKNTRLAALSLLVIFLYGSMVWGIFPDFSRQKNTSWEGHLSGALTGLVLAVIYRKKPVFEEEITEEEEDIGDDFFFFRYMPVRDPLLKKSSPLIRIKSYKINVDNAPRENVQKHSGGKAEDERERPKIHYQIKRK